MERGTCNMWALLQYLPQADLWGATGIARFSLPKFWYLEKGPENIALRVREREVGSHSPTDIITSWEIVGGALWPPTKKDVESASASLAFLSPEVTPFIFPHPGHPILETSVTIWCSSLNPLPHGWPLLNSRPEFLTASGSLPLCECLFYTHLKLLHPPNQLAPNLLFFISLHSHHSCSVVTQARNFEVLTENFCVG